VVLDIYCRWDSNPQGDYSPTHFKCDP